MKDIWPDHKEIIWNFSYISLYIHAETAKMGPSRQEKRATDIVNSDSIVEKEKNCVESVCSLLSLHTLGCNPFIFLNKSLLVMKHLVDIIFQLTFCGLIQDPEKKDPNTFGVGK